MVESPDVQLRIEEATTWSVSGTLAERALAFAQRFALASQPAESAQPLSPCRLTIERAGREHVGLGVGTQLGMAVASGLARFWGRECDHATLAHRVGRGLRSALGVHGFAHGGLLVEAGKTAEDRLAPLVARLPFPASWRLVLATSAEETSAAMHGGREAEAFAQLNAHPASSERTDRLCRLVLLGLLPAAAEQDLNAFGAALHEFNRRVGETFAPVQGGVYASPRVAEVVRFTRAQGIAGVGQSSWGPTVFAVVADDDRATHLAAQLRNRFDLQDDAVLVTAACNHGARLEAS